MRGVWVNNNGPSNKGLAELNHHIPDDQKEVRDGVDGDGQEISEEDESRMNEDVENDGSIMLVHAKAALDGRQQSQGPPVRWEWFLPIRSLKVLLVENDGSTRHVVSALLRNCSYEVTAVANGLEAWKILQCPTNRIDLVLTEVAMPCISGIGLLSKIMSHKICKNIPVIMMSSNDSMGTVFKCLSKGAVDFLVKPIRKNELKNLWQHVWRKCHSSSGSGSESGIQTHKSNKSKTAEGSDNDTGSNHEDENGSIGLDVGDESDNGSGTRGSWSKRPGEVESSQPMSPWDQLEDPPDSTCAQVVHSRPEAFGKNQVPTAATKEGHEQDFEFDNVAMGKELEMGVPRNPGLQSDGPTNNDKNFVFDVKKHDKRLEKGKSELSIETSYGQLGNEAADLIGIITDCTDLQMESLATGTPNDLSRINHIKVKATCDTKEILSLELSLKRQKAVGDAGTSAQEQNVLRHSDLSAFSRYNNTSTANQASTGNLGSCFPLDNSSEAATHHLQCNSNGTPNQRSNGSSNNNDMGSTTNDVFTKPDTISEKSMPKYTVNEHLCSVFQPLQHGHVSSLQHLTPGKTDAASVNMVFSQPKAMHQQVQVQHHHHHYHHYHHHVHNTQKQQQRLPSHENLSLRNMVTATPHCGPSNLLSTSIEENAANYGSASGSNNGSNGQNGNSGQHGCTSAAIAEGTNMETHNGVAGNCGIGGGSGYGSRSGVEQNQLAHRQAALNKLRQKRKERCFEKKVRYQSRKKLAEQRPRVRGQFVRQAAKENKNADC